MSNNLVLGLFIGVFIGLLFVVFFKLTKNDGSIECKYDERQAGVRGKGFKYAFFTLMFYDAIYGIIGITYEKSIIDPLVAMVLGICISVAIYASYCIWYDAYFSLNENPKKVLFGLGFLGTFNLVIGTTRIMSGELFTNGVLNYHSTNLICGILFIVIFLVLLAKRIKNRMEAE